MKFIQSEIIGKLTQDKEFDDWWHGAKTPIPYFSNNELPIDFEFSPEEDPNFCKEVDIALINFLKKGTTDRMLASELVYRNCTEFLTAVGYSEQDKSLWEIKNQEDVWSHVHPTQIYLQRRFYNDKKIYLTITCECDWEVEHGLQLVFRQGEYLTRVSAQDGHLTEADAYNKPDSEDELLSRHI